MLGAKWDGRTVMAPEHRQRMRPSKQSRSGPRKKSSPSPSGQAMKSRPLLPSLTNTICPTTPGGRRAQRFQGNFPLYLFQQFNSIQFNSSAKSYIWTLFSLRVIWLSYVSIPTSVLSMPTCMFSDLIATHPRLGSKNGKSALGQLDFDGR